MFSWYKKECFINNIVRTLWFSLALDIIAHILLLRLSPAVFHSVIHRQSREFLLWGKMSTGWLMIEKLFFLTHILRSVFWKLLIHLKCIEEMCSYIWMFAFKKFFNVFSKVMTNFSDLKIFSKLYHIVFLAYLYFFLIENKYISHRNYRFTQYYGQIMG